MTVPGPVVVLTRAPDDNVPLARLAAARGAEVLQLPCLRIEPVAPACATPALQDALSRADAVVFASRHGAARLGEVTTGQASALAPACRLLAVGPATAAAVQARFGRPCAVAEAHHAEGLLRATLQALGPAPRHVVLPCAEDGRTTLADGLVAAGHVVDRLVLYRTVPATPRVPKMTFDGRVHYIVCASPSAVRGFFAQADWPPRGVALSIGPTTSAAFVAHHQRVAGQAHPHDGTGLAALLTTTLETS